MNDTVEQDLRDLRALRLIAPARSVPSSGSTEEKVAGRVVVRGGLVGAVDNLMRELLLPD